MKQSFFICRLEELFAPPPHWAQQLRDRLTSLVPVVGQKNRLLGRLPGLLGRLPGLLSPRLLRQQGGGLLRDGLFLWSLGSVEKRRVRVPLPRRLTLSVLLSWSVLGLGQQRLGGGLFQGLAETVSVSRTTIQELADVRICPRT